MRSTTIKVVVLALIGVNLFVGVLLFAQMQDPAQQDFLSLAARTAFLNVTDLSSTWIDSPAYERYLQQARFTSNLQPGLLRTRDYCNQFVEFIKNYPIPVDSRGLPIPPYKTVFSDYKSKNLVKTAFTPMATLVLPELTIDTDPEEVEPLALPLDLLMFYHKSPDWHLYMRIGSEWLCPGQRYNHLPGHEIISNKDMIASALKTYGELYKDRPHCFDPWEFMPFTYNLAAEEDCSEFLNYLQTNTDWNTVQWIMKKSRNSHNSEGVSLLDADEAARFVEMYDGQCGNSRVPKYIAQRYIANPLLINQRKFDFRIYMLIANLDPLIVLYHDGFLRVSGTEYNLTSHDLGTHVTNTQLVKNALEAKSATKAEYERVMLEQMWTLERFEEHMIAQGSVSKGWLDEFLRPLMKEKMAHLVRASAYRFLQHPGVFELFGLDFLFDTDLNLWLLEVNRSPAMQATTEEKGRIQEQMQQEILDIEFGLMFGVDIDSLVKNFEFVIDGRKRGPQKYTGLISKACL